MRKLHQLSLNGALTCLSIAAISPSAQAVTLWNWSFTTDVTDIYGSGTFTTADVVPTPGTIYTITGISGTYNRDGTAYSITGLSTTLDNTFQWTGEFSSINVGDAFASSGISFNTSVSEISFIQYADLSYFPMEYASTFITSYDGVVNFSTVTPGSAAPVPAPLPLFGAAAAFSAVRRLRGLSGRLHRSEG
jgi:hypothetical protein